MSFDPSARGPFSVASRSGVAIDRARDDRALPFEVWHPVDGDGGPHPIVLYSHASGGGRRQSSFLCEHLASHGYVVAAADHVGNTAADFAASAARAAADAQSTTAEREASLRRIISDRVPDLRFMLDRILGGAAGDARIDHERIGIVGWSFGGWAALEVDERFRALVALAPAGNSKPLPGIIPATLTFRWKREVSTLILAAERDRSTPLAGIYELLERTPSRRRLFILRGADHGHFADDIGEPGGCSPEAAHLFTRSLALAHMDVVLRTMARRGNSSLMTPSRCCGRAASTRPNTRRPERRGTPRKSAVPTGMTPDMCTARSRTSWTSRVIPGSQSRAHAFLRGRPVSWHREGFF